MEPANIRILKASKEQQHLKCEIKEYTSDLVYNEVLRKGLKINLDLEQQHWQKAIFQLGTTIYLCEITE